MLFIDEVSPCTLFKVCSYYCFSHHKGGNEGSVLLCLFKMRGPSQFTGLVTVLCNRNGLASYNICVYVSGGALVVHDGQKYTKRQ